MIPELPPQSPARVGDAPDAVPARLMSRKSQSVAEMLLTVSVRWVPMVSERKKTRRTADAPAQLSVPVTTWLLSNIITDRLLFGNDIVKLVKDISVLENIKIKGLMTMAPYFDDAEKDRPYFKLTKRLFDEIKAMNISGVEMEVLSMGMSHSYKIAIEEGANMIRIGTRIFGCS